MSTFKLTIRTDNAAFTDAGGAELARILRRIADDVQDFQLPLTVNIKTQQMLDSNGNRVGGWSWDASCDCGAHEYRDGYTHDDWAQQNGTPQSSPLSSSRCSTDDDCEYIVTADGNRWVVTFIDRNEHVHLVGTAGYLNKAYELRDAHNAARNRAQL